MERRNKESRQSSLPSSLIPHLYSRPQQDDPLATTPFPTLPLPTSTGPEEEPEFSERTDLPSMRSSFVLPPVSSSFAPPLPPVDAHRTPSYLNYEARHLPGEHTPTIQTPSSADVPASGIVRSMGSLSLPSQVSSQRYASYSDPHYHTTRPERMSYGLNQNYPPPVTQGASPPRGSWREGEAGPSSLVHAPYESARSSGRRGSSQPAQLTRHAEAFQHRGDVSDGDAEGYSSRGREGYPGGASHSTQRGSLYSAWPSETYTSHVPHDIASSQIPTGYSQFPLTTVGSHGAWAGTSGGSGFGDYPGYSPNSASDVSSDGRPDDDGDGDGDGDDTYTTAQKGKKRQRSSDAGADSTRKSRNPRKTAVACNFCRGRKLRCNGAKPACSNCMVRKFQCEYVPVQRRRGPGKAPKGTKSKKSSTGRSEPSTSLPPGDRGSGVMPEGPEHTPISLETFSFNPLSERAPPRGPGWRQRYGSRSPSVDSEPEQRR